MNFSHLKVSTRLIATFAILLSLMLGLSLFIYVSISSVQVRSQGVTDNNILTLQSIADMSSSSLTLRTDEMKYAYVVDLKDAAQVRDTEEHMKFNIAKFEGALRSYTERAEDPQEKRFADQLSQQWADMINFHNRLMPLVQQQQEKKVDDLLATDGIATRTALENQMVKVYANEVKQSADASQEVRQSFSTMQTFLIIGCAIAVLFAIATAWLLMRYLLNAFRETVVVAQRIAAGNLVEPVAGRDTRNEVGDLLKAMDDMRTSLANTVSSVRENADSVASASEQIARGNTDLSSRTEEQASALEETASAMEELSATIKQNTDNAMNADRLAQDASQVANDGGDIVKRVVTRMQDINEGANRVVEVISLLDSIAFQTNLLALNASVEAARAGEQGRGFAVVASEVRNLAQRSAEASREIGALITESVNSIRSGTELANEAGTTIDEVVKSVGRLKDIMSEISAASYEQNQGVSQVSTAVTQMDQTTQQNAALVEESAAAAASLYEQARELQNTVKVFKINTSHDFSTVNRQPVTRKTPSEASTAPKSHSTAKAKPVKASHDSNDDWETF
ncbi:methyl-accepting chemotaxis protein [Zymobacter palmae]|uniref:Methyl-accepting chemotaxis protein n=1 Tax=Zymobacter palmae TaxID=33074 RepID=A0A348HBA3_9GAMM|nr:methyl-accepting chemotaxis protein [Zymobacter palmae]BBG28905.1 methyl-accepting chemotaxis protein [Zymobacter palmae]